MRETPSPFYAYRYLVAPSNNQTSILHDLNKRKEDLMIDIYESINVNHKTTWIKGQKKYLFIGFQKSNDLYIIKFAREKIENIYIEKEEDIEIENIKEVKFVYLFVDTTNQIILIEQNKRIFGNISNAIEVIEDFLRTIMMKNHYSVNIYPLVSTKKFWNYVNTADEIFELSLLLNAPNMNHGGEDTRSVLQKVKDLTNNETLNLSIKNKDGKLKLIRETIGDWIDYVREVGGKYSLKFKKDGVIDTKTSETDTSKTQITCKKKSKYSDEELENIKAKMNQIHDLKDRDNADEEII
jgi:hypothetical protein